MKNYLRITTTVAALVLASAAQAVSVPATTSSPTALGSITAGQTYTVTATGAADLLITWNGGLGIPFTANGIPTYAIPGTYSSFYPNGLDYDPSQNTSAHGIGGAGVLFGALLGTFTASPTGPADYFLLGSNYNFTAGSSGTLYGVVNDCPNCYADNSGGFTVTLSLATGLPVGVPEPGTWAMMLLGLGGIGFAMRSKKVLQPVSA
ncbi:PEPxxWA-CTERM sorting domain-containing protein [Sphingomonas sp.]|uniref:PEPxxWA-CTERM sorting domain-containing protein n=1 Tax=Sphingomonas sp. TaxID=28214 RepID=UPI0038A4A1AA